MSQKMKHDGQSNTEKNPSDWKTGDEPMTGAQRSYLNTLAGEVGKDADASLTKAEASEQIDVLRQQAVTHRDDADGSNTQKDPKDWKTGDEPMTGAQRSYLKTLSDEAGKAVDDNLTKAEASEQIDKLRAGNPRTQ